MPERKVIPLVRGVKCNLYGTNAEILKQSMAEGLVPIDVYRETKKVIELNDYLQREVVVQTKQKEMQEENNRHLRSVVAEGMSLYYQQKNEKAAIKNRTYILVAAGTMIGIAIGAGTALIATMYMLI